METNQKQERVNQQGRNNRPQGFYADVRVRLSQDGFVTHELPGGMRITKHKNYYLAILGIPFTPKVKPEVSQEAGVV